MGIENPEQGKRMAWYEETYTIESVARAVASYLRCGGRLCLYQRSERLTDTLMTLCASGLEPKRLRFIQAREDKAPKFLLLRARKSGWPGDLLVELSLILHSKDGTFTRETLETYGSCREEH